MLLYAVYMNAKLMRTKIRSSMDESIFDVLNIVFLLGLGVLFLYPIVYVFSASISRPLQLIRGEVLLLPKGITLDSYREAV